MAMIRPYWFDVLPLRIKPKQLESFTSYLIRLAEKNGLHSTTALAAVCFPDQTLNIVRNLRDYPLPTMKSLETVATCSEADLLTTTFYHLGKKFGRSMLSRSLSAFLSDSLAEYLRYCPICIADQGYYSLAWRFPLLQGCHIHSRKLLDECVSCNRPIPFIGPLFRIGICPNCKSDLRGFLPQPLNREEKSIAEATFRELEFLLSPQLWEDNDPPVHIGAYFAYLRQKKHLTMEAVSDYLKKDIRSVICVELAPVEIGGTTFESYVNYARLLDITLANSFNRVLSGAVDKMMRSQRRVPSESELIEKMKIAAEILRSRGEPVTKTAITRVAEISSYQLLKYSSSKAYFEQLVGENRGVGRKVLLRTKKVFEDVQRAIAYLEEIGEPATTRRIGNLVGVDPTYFRDHPHINMLLKESMMKYHTFYDLKRNQEKEEELLLKVEVAIQELEASHQPVTQRSIGRIVGKRPEKLKVYPRIEALLQQKANWSQRQQEQVRSHEDDLLVRVEIALQQLEALGKAKTLRAVGQIVGVSSTNFRLYPRVRDLLMQHIEAYRERYEPLVSEQETHLLAKVIEAIELLENKGYPVTQRAVSRLIGVTSHNFIKFASIKSLFEQRADQQYEYQADQGKQREEELLVKVEEAIELLRKLGQPITQQSLSDIVGKSSDTLRKFVRVRELLMQYTKSQQIYAKTLARTHEDKYTEKVRKTRQGEEELFAEIKTVLEQLENAQQTISIRALSRKFGISQSYLYSRPDVISSINEFIQRTKPKVLALQFQRREEELVQGVLEAIGQLQSTKQRVSVSAITRLVHLSEAALYHYPKVRLILKDIAEKWRHRAIASS